MAWHFTKDKTITICSLLHDIGMPCFSHCIDYLMEDYDQQESSELDIISIVKNSSFLLELLEKDHIDPSILSDLSRYSIIENSKPKLCTDRLDGVLHTVLIWLHTHPIESIQQVYSNLTVLENEEKQLEIGFQTQETAELFFDMVTQYALELQSNRNKYVLQFVADCVRSLISHHLLTIDDLYTKKEQDIVSLFKQYIPAWSKFQQSPQITSSTIKPDGYSVCLQCKKRYVLPLCLKNNQVYRLNEISIRCEQWLEEYFHTQNCSYAYIPEIQKIECIL